MATKDVSTGFIGHGTVGRGMTINCAKKGLKLVVQSANALCVSSPVTAAARLVYSSARARSGETE